MRKVVFTFNFILLGFIYSECSDLNYADCLYWSYYCEWNDETNQCQDIGGGGENDDLGPYEYQIITESDGLRNGPDYRDGRLYYPIDGIIPLKSIVLTPGWSGDSGSMASWAEYFSSYGFIAMTIGPNDEINDSHEMRAEGLIDAIETIKQEELRIESPIFGMIEPNSFIVSGYSMGGGASQVALTLGHPYVDDSIIAAIALNPTIIFEDCDLCPEDGGYCICLVPEMLDHDIPTLIVAGQFELNELPDYDGLLGQDIYENTPETTIKMLFEVAGGGHGSSYEAEAKEKALQWAKYHLLGDSDICESLIEEPGNASEFLTTLSCNQQLPGDINGDELINVQDVILTVNLILNNEYDSSADLNLDNSVNIQDVILILNIILD